MAPSELILNPDGSVYHLHLRPEQLADTIITVGDPDRVGDVSQYFDRVDEKVQKREFVTHTGELNGHRISVISTGIGTDNIDIVFNELDALATVNLDRRELADHQRQLTFIRIGTSGALQADLGIDTWLASSAAVGLEGLMHYYQAPQATAPQTALLSSLTRLLCKSEKEFPIPPYWTDGNLELLELFADDKMQTGVTLTAAGFYAPQGREIRLKSHFNRAFIDELVTWRNGTYRLTNLEMETAGIYGLAHLLGHRAISLNALLANRATGEFSQNPGKTVDELIRWTLEKISC